MSWLAEFFDDPIYGVEYEPIIRDRERAVREVEFILRMLVPGNDARVLDLACGHGRHALVLATSVAEVVGVDRTEQAISYAIRQAQEQGIANARFSLGDMRTIDFEREFDIAYNYFTSWGYLSDDENVDVLRRLHRALKPGGRLLLETLNRDCMLRNFRPKGWNVLKDGSYILNESRFDSATGRYHTRRTTIVDGKPKMIEIDRHIYAPEEILRLFREIGFREVRLVSAPDGGEVTLDTPRIAIIGERTD